MGVLGGCPKAYVENVYVLFLAKGKYGCTEVRVYPTECGEELGTDPSKIGSSKSLILKSFSGEGTLWDSSLPVSLTLCLGYACTFYAPTSPPPIFCPLFIVDDSGFWGPGFQNPYRALSARKPLPARLEVWPKACMTPPHRASPVQNGRGQTCNN